MLTTRREFLIGGVKVGALVPLIAGAARPLGWLEGSGERCLVVLQLSGGNDALNMVVPHRQDAYYRMRPTIGQARGALHALDADHGLHPAMGALGALYGDGRLAVVHGVGYPEPNRSHFRSMEIWQTADPEHPPGDSGWLGRLADQLAAQRPGSLPALHVGDGELPLALRSPASFTPSVRGYQGFELHRGQAAIAAERDALLERPGAGELAFLREAARATYLAAARMAELADRPAQAEYPGDDLSQRLKLVARLIAGGFGTRVFDVELAGFDTHSRQAQTHAALLGQLSGALAAFHRDLEAQGQGGRVITLVFSEFGRRVEENGSKGTDHGAAAPVLLAGSAVRPGMHGTPPDLQKLVEGDIAYSTDFRSLYAMLERDWLGLKPSTAVAPAALLAS